MNRYLAGPLFALAAILAFASTAARAATVLWWEAEPNNFLANGDLNGFFQAPASPFQVRGYHSGLGEGIEVSVGTGQGNRGVFIESRTGPLAAGAYEPAGNHVATIAPFIGMNTVNCVRIVGRFTILELVYVPNTLTIDKLAVNYEMRCASSPAPDSRYFGEVRINSEVPLTINQPAGRTAPDAFAFKPRDTLAPGTQRVSNEITVYGINAPSPISITGGEYSVNGAPFTATPGTVVNRDRVRVRASSPATPGDTGSATLTIGGVSAPFNLTNYLPGQVQTGLFARERPGQDPVPALFQSALDAGFSTVVSTPQQLSFIVTDETGQERTVVVSPRYPSPLVAGPFENTIYQGANFNPRGDYNTPDCAPSFIPGRFVVRDVDFDPPFGPLRRFAVDIEMACDSGPHTYAELRYNSTVPFSFQEPAGKTQPDAFALLARSPAAAGATVTTNYITVYGTNAPSPISISNGEYSVNSGPYTATAGMVQPLDHVLVRTTAPARGGEPRQVTLNIGGQTASFTVETYRPGMVLSGLYLYSASWWNPVDLLSLAPHDYVEQTTFVGNPAPAGVSIGNEAQLGGEVAFTGPNGTAIVPGLYTDLGTFGQGDKLGPLYRLSGCSNQNPQPGYVRIHEIGYLPDGKLERMAADFETRCDNAGFGPVRGEVRFNSTVPFSKLAPPNPADFGADGKADLLFQNGDGSLLALKMNGTQSLESKSLFGAGTGWMVTHLADLDGDRKADIFFKHLDGRVYVYRMNDLSFIGQELLGAGLGWSVSHTADLNGDGKADLILKHLDGRAHLWQMEGTLVVGSASLLPAASGWNVVGTGDLNGDGKADIVFMHDDGRGYVYLMNGTTIIGSVGFLSPGSGWTVSHVADMNGDGKSDLIFRHTDGSAYLFLMNGTTFGAGVSLLGPGTGWSVTHTGDLNGDGKDDIVFRHTDGRAHVRLMNGTAILSASDVLPAASGWSVTHLYDLNGDGKKDLVFRHTDGRVTVRLMDGLTTLSSANVMGAGNWAVVP